MLPTVFDLKDPNLLLEIDSYLIEQVLINLLLNALDATAEVANPKIIVSASIGHNGKPQIRVSDNGTGIPSKSLTVSSCLFLVQRKPEVALA